MTSLLSTDTKHLRLAKILGALSYALDITEGQSPGHCIRCCWIGMQVGTALGMSDAELSDLFYIILLKDLGCSSNAARIYEFFDTDDLTFKRDLKRVDGSLPQTLSFAVSHTGSQSGLTHRLRAILGAMKSDGAIIKELVETRSQRGADIARQLDFSEDVALGIQFLDEHWDGSGQPTKIKGRDIPRASQIALLSQVVDVMHTATSAPAARREIENRTRKWFDPEICRAFDEIASHPDFWHHLDRDDLETEIYEMEPTQCIREVGEDSLDTIATVFSQIIDAKSLFTRGHSERVMLYTDLIAKHMELSVEQRRRLKRAALLHDIGNLGLSNSVLDKLEKLNEEEFALINRHPIYAEEILSRISAYFDVVSVAAGHHERLDGKGYPHGLHSEEISLDTRIVTVADFFDALTAEHPYRAAMPMDKALAIMEENVGGTIDGECFEALKAVSHKMNLSKAA